MKCATCGDFLKKGSKFCSSCGGEVMLDANTNPRFARPPEKYTGPKRLYRSRSNRMVAGVCGGLGSYFEVDPNLIRLIWGIMLISGIGFLAYLLAIVLIPESPLDPWSE